MVKGFLNIAAIFKFYFNFSSGSAKNVMAHLKGQ
jgi:hypothetical protein